MGCDHLVRAVIRFGARAALGFLIACLAVVPAFGAGATLQWDANTEPDLAGYKLHYGLTTGNYTTALDNPANKAFLDAFRKKYNRLSNYTGEHGYVGAMMLDKALQATQGNIEDKDGFIKALEKVEIPDAPRGPVKLDQYHNVVNNIYIMEVQKVNNQLVNAVIETFKDTTQFWKWKPDELMKMTPYADMKGKWVK